MTGYLQRLFDRGGDAPAPAAASMSPVAQADQRLTVPGISDALMWQPPAFGFESEPGPEISPFESLSPPAAGRRAEAPAPRSDTPGRPERAQPLPPPKMTRAESPLPIPVPQPELPPAYASPIARIGAIDAGDLELQASPEAQPATPEPQQEFRPATPSREQPALPPVTDREPGTRSAAAEPSPIEPAPRFADRDERQTEREPLAVRPEPLPQPETLPIAEPVPPAPVAAVPVPNPEPAPLEVAPLPQEAPWQQAPRPEPRRVETYRAPETQRQPRPLTANEVSVIGPLPASRRSATFFGVRRR